MQKAWELDEEGMQKAWELNEEGMQKAWELNDRYRHSRIRYGRKIQYYLRRIDMATAGSETSTTFLARANGNNEKGCLEWFALIQDILKHRQTLRTSAV